MPKMVYVESHWGLLKIGRRMVNTVLGKHKKKSVCF